MKRVGESIGHSEVPVIVVYMPPFCSPLLVYPGVGRCNPPRYPGVGRCNPPRYPGGICPSTLMHTGGICRLLSCTRVGMYTLLCSPGGYVHPVMLPGWVYTSFLLPGWVYTSFLATRVGIVPPCACYPGGYSTPLCMLPVYPWWVYTSPYIGHPTTPWVYLPHPTTRGGYLVTAVLRLVSGEEALGSSWEKPLGGGPLRVLKS